MRATTNRRTSASSIETDLSLSQLQAELARIDLLIHRQVKLWQLAGQDPADTFRGLYISDTEANLLLARPFSGHWGQTAMLAPEEDRAFAEAEAQATGLTRSLVEMAQSQEQTLRLTHLAAAFGLDRFELDTLLVCLAPTLDLRYERLYGYLQDDVTRKRPSVNLVLNLLGPPGPERLPLLSYFAPTAPLFNYQLLERKAETGAPLLGQTLAVDEAIVTWLLGNYQPHADLGTQAALLWPQPDAAVTGLLAARWPSLERAVSDLAIIV
ncbi:MAG: hypothetical protein AB1801_21485, partial [Chloroflexota bacterium]